MATKNHVHTIKRVRGQKNRYKCTDPDCSYVNTINLLEHKRVKCPYCSTEFFLKRKDFRLAVPHCGCIKGTKIEPENALLEDLLADKLFNEGTNQ